VGGLGAGNSLIEFAAKRGFTYVPSPFESFITVKARVEHYRETLLASGRDPSEVEWPIIRHVYVGESTEGALRDAEGPLTALYQKYHQKGLVSQAEGRSVSDAELTWPKLLEDRVIVGDWRTVVDKIKTYYDEVGTSHVICQMSLPGLEHHKVMSAIRLFAGEVSAKLQA
jgi:alkanesulfonate monooxygenase SsuD/methylene tetrahydromethanopterin reductase-like flavin-dependent oxidoreductase (luciferase family)